MERAAAAGRPVRDWQWTPLDSVAPIAACAVIISEDDQFFNIGTLNYAIQREAFRRMMRGDFSAGGSGFAQQLARNLFLGPQRTPRRKAREYLLAWQISHALTKTRQLEIYLNVVEWGDGVWGIDAASRHYFAMPPARLNGSQSVILATMLPSPRRGFAYAASTRSARKTSTIVRGLTRSMLIDELAGGALIERLGLWRRGVAAGRSQDEIVTGVDSIMGPEPAPHALLDTDQRPIDQACNSRRRPG